MPVKIDTYFLILICFYSVCVNAQTKQAKEKKLIQFSGLLLQATALSPNLCLLPALILKEQRREPFLLIVDFFHLLHRLAMLLNSPLWDTSLPNLKFQTHYRIKVFMDTGPFYRY